MTHNGEMNPLYDAGMYDLLADYYKYTNPELHIFYYQKHLQSVKKVLETTHSPIPYVQRQKEYGKIRILHGSIETPKVDIYINGMRMFKEMTFKKMSNDLTLPTGRYQIDIYEAGKMVDTYCSQKIIVESNIYHTMAFVGSKEKLKIYSFEEHPHVPVTETKLRFIHLAPTLSTIHIAVQNGDVIFPKVEAKTASPYLGLHPMTVYLEARASSTNELITTFSPLVLQENKSYSAIILESDSETSNVETLLVSTT
ncbi:DUF4397 domain-containing protein [Niallia sp. 01092]|uniref:DUF4397 domain-containing protein n=1 Tax=unclassified Niallia TaxID=2837522 RepID=UPI003FD1A4C9